jgi:hypothetical protein
MGALFCHVYRVVWQGSARECRFATSASLAILMQELAPETDSVSLNELVSLAVLEIDGAV